MNPKKNQYAEILEFINEANETFALEKQLTENSIRQSGIDPDKVRKHIESDTDSTIEELKTELALETEEAVEITEESITAAINDIKELKASEDELKELEDEANQSIQECVDYMNSIDYENKIKARRDKFAKELEDLESAEKKDYVTINALKKEIKNIDDRYTLAFMFDDRFVQTKNMTDIFFDNKRSNYMVQKYVGKCNQLGIDPNCFKYFFNLEEKFLEEKYHPFNNLFLFTCLREISNITVHTDADRIRMIIRSLHRLFYNKFACEEFRDTLLNSIRAYLDRYIADGYTDMYLEKNITHPNHPHRKEKDANREKELRERLYAQMMKEGYIESAAEVENLSIKELYAFLDKKNVEKLEAAMKKAEENKADGETNEESDETTDKEVVEETKETKVIELEDSISMNDEISEDVDEDTPSETVEEATDES